MEQQDNALRDAVPLLLGINYTNVSFERLLFTILPTLLVVALSPFYLRYYYLQPARVLPRTSLWAKLIVAGGLAIVELFNFRIRRSAPALQVDSTVSVSAMPFIAALCIAFVVTAEHRRAIQSSTFIGIYLLITFVHDLARAYSYAFRPEAQALAGLAIFCVALKISLLLLMSDGGQVVHPIAPEDVGEGETNDCYGPSFFGWLHSTLFLGFRKTITIDSLAPLGPEFSSKILSDRLELSLQQTNKGSRFGLIKACLQHFHADLFQTLLTRACHSGFLFCQPLLLQHAVAYIAYYRSSRIASAGLIAASSFLALGIAISRSIYNRMNSRLVTTLRGAITPLVVKRSLGIPGPIAKDLHDLPQINSDIEHITANLSDLNEMWAACFDLAVCFYLLSNLVDGAASAIIKLLIVGGFLYAFGVAVYRRTSASWKKSVENRVSQTNKALFQIKSIKIMGIETTISKRLQNLQAKEIAAYRASRLAAIALTIISVSIFAAMHVLAVGQCLSPVSFGEAFTAAKVFTTLAVMVLVSYAYSETLRQYPELKEILACFDRLQTHLLLYGSQGIPDNINNATIADSLTQEKRAEPQIILNNVTFNLCTSQITAILGSPWSRKTTLLRAIMGHATLLHGQVLRKRCKIAYCGQRPWLRNTSIRKNIIGPNPFDPVLYEVVLNSCALNQDLQQLPNRDLTIVGINGAKLSGGQKHKVALARGLYSRAPVFLVDDIFGELDATTAQDIHSRLFGPKGVLRRSTSTVVFVTHSASFMKVADQALILESNGAISVLPNPSQVTLSADFIGQLRSSSTAIQSTTMEVGPGPRSTAMTDPEFGEDESIIQRVDWALYRYFLAPTSMWKVIIGLIFVALGVANELSMDVYIRFWLESGSIGSFHFNTYAKIGVCSTLTTLCATWYWMWVTLPRNSLKLHKRLLDTVTGATLSHLTSADMGSIMNRFAQDMTLLTDSVPKALYSFIYFAVHLALSTAIIVSGAKFSAFLVPLLTIVFYGIPFYFLRASRQMKDLDAEAAAGLHTLFMEVSSGREHIRGFGWQQNLVTEAIQALDYSQKPYYHNLAIQCWAELAMNFSNIGLVILLVSVATSAHDTTSQESVGLSLLNLVTYSSKLNVVVASWVTLEAALACVARLRTFIRGTPAERHNASVELPPQWPQSGNIVLSNVTAQYNPMDRTAILNDVSFTIQGGQKVGISGRSGSGKTSLLLTMLRLIEYTGTIVIDGIDISAVSPQQLRSRITTVSQDPIKLDSSVRDNILVYEGQLEDETITDDIILEALDQVGLTEIIENRGGLDVLLFSMELSEGQMQLLSLSGAIVHHTCTQSRVVLLDEPTSSLDLETDDKIQLAIREAFLDCTILIVSHRPETHWDANACFEVRNNGVFKIAVPRHPRQQPRHIWE